MSIECAGANRRELGSLGMIFTGVDGVIKALTARAALDELNIFFIDPAEAAFLSAAVV